MRVFGPVPHLDQRQVLARIGFVAQDRPLYRSFSVAQMLGFGAHLNPVWNDALARNHLLGLQIPLDRKVSELSGGQQAQVALALALGKQPELLLLDEPLSNLDPLARRDFARNLLDAAASSGLTVIFSSHVVSELERFCDYVVIINQGCLQVAGDVDELLEEQRRLAGPTSLEDFVLGYLRDPERRRLTGFEVAGMEARS